MCHKVLLFWLKKKTCLKYENHSQLLGCTEIGSRICLDHSLLVPALGYQVAHERVMMLKCATQECNFKQEVREMTSVSKDPRESKVHIVLTGNGQGQLGSLMKRGWADPS